MKKNILLRTNMIICIIIIFGFLLTSIISYCSNNGMFKQDIEHISTLTSDGIYYEIDSIFTKPINISLTMANDTFLKTFLTNEKVHENDEEFAETIRNYLLAYKLQYDYESVFLVSTKTNRYYHFDKGIDRILTKDNSENEWYYTFLESQNEYFLNIDNDEVKTADNKITIFINCKIYSSTGETIGVVGIGFDVDTLQKIFRGYEETYNIKAYLIDTNGTIEISTTQTGFVNTNLFKKCAYDEYKDYILNKQKNKQYFWYSSNGKKGFLVTKYIPDLKWHLIIEKDTTSLETYLNIQFFACIFIIILVIGVVLFITTNIIRKYNNKIVNLIIEKEKSHRTVFQTETEKLYENIYEIDITHNRAASEAAESYFESLGASKNSLYDEALKVIAMKQIKEEYRNGYLSTFSTSSVLKSYNEGKESLNYDFMITNDEGYTYYWMRITARIFYWKDDQSVRMLVYRQNIDNEKQREIRMAEKMQKDSLSGLYNKAATQELIHKILINNDDKIYVFFILDIDNFKNVNDTCGHAIGDLVITDFSKKLKAQFRDDDIVGRIGGDEFVVFVPASSREWIENKAKLLSNALKYEFSDGINYCQISASIGITIASDSETDFETLYKNADSALYKTKESGKKGYTIY